MGPTSTWKTSQLWGWGEAAQSEDPDPKSSFMESRFMRKSERPWQGAVRPAFIRERGLQGGWPLLSRAVSALPRSWRSR